MGIDGILCVSYGMVKGIYGMKPKNRHKKSRPKNESLAGFMV